jgi:hypothetical protein
MTAVRGWVYIITNEAMPGLVKVGYSTKDPSLRAGELNHTGSPTPYQVVYDALVPAPREVEQRAHAALKEYRAGKEWFRCSASKATEAIRSVVGDALILESSSATDLGRETASDASSVKTTVFATPEDKEAAVQKILGAWARAELERQPPPPMPTTPDSESYKERALAAQKQWKLRQRP